MTAGGPLSASGPPAEAGRNLAPVGSPVVVSAAAKVNLHLRVGPRRSDGFHSLVSVFQAVSLTDEVTARLGTGRRLSLTGEGAALVPTGRKNLALRAAQALAQYADVRLGVHLHITKAIPVAGGMAGGSADAAAALVACNTLWGLDLDRGTLAGIAAGLGSDVPFALHGGTALGTGRGEHITEVLSVGEYHWVFALAERGLATPEVYTELDRLRATGELPPRGDGDDGEPVLAALRTGDPAQLGKVLHNDLQPAALRLRPALRRTLAAGEDLGARGAIVSGSGPTCAFLAADRLDSIRLAAALSGAGVCRTVRRGYGPVPGARVIST